MADQWPEEYLDFQLASQTHNDEDHMDAARCSPVRHSLHWRDLSYLLSSVHVPKWMREEVINMNEEEEEEEETEGEMFKRYCFVTVIKRVSQQNFRNLCMMVTYQ